MKKNEINKIISRLLLYSYFGNMFFVSAEEDPNGVFIDIDINSAEDVVLDALKEDNEENQDQNSSNDDVNYIGVLDSSGSLDIDNSNSVDSDIEYEDIIVDGEYIPGEGLSDVDIVLDDTSISFDDEVSVENETKETLISDNWLNRHIAYQIFGDEEKYTLLTDSDYLKVTTIDLSSSNLCGEIPSDIGKLTNLKYLYLQNNSISGEIPESIGNLKSLKYLYLQNNELSGKIPESIGNLKNLSSLYLYINNLDGEIPESIFNIPTLKRLDLKYNSLSGNISNNIGNLNNLVDCSLSHNNLSGTIPSSITSLSNLKTLDISSNNISGTIPSDIGNLINLTNLSLSKNSFSGVIPVSITNLVNLVNLELDNNLLTGSIPSDIGKLLKLKILYIDNNKLTGSIPSSIGDLSVLEYIYLYSNNIEGNIPVSLGNINSLIELRLESNNLSGAIPESLGNISTLVKLRLDSNKLSGEIPASLGNLQRLKYLYLNNNNLNGQIPESLGNLSKLTRMYLQYNNLTGVIPSSFDKLNLVTKFDISNNYLIGAVNTSLLNKFGVDFFKSNFLSNIPNQNRITFSSTEDITISVGETLDSNKINSLINIYTFENQILQNDIFDFEYIFDKISFFDENNVAVTSGETFLNVKLTGTDIVTDNNLKIIIEDNSSNVEIEDNWLNRNVAYQVYGDESKYVDLKEEDYLKITTIDLNNTNIEGEIPECISKLANLQYLNLSNNNISGNMPEYLSKLTLIKEIRLYNNNIDGSIPEYIGELKNLTLLDLKNNNISGILPESIANATSLKYLYLGGNKIEGQIPNNIDKLSKLIELGLDNNMLTGNMPESLGNLSSIKYLYLQSNQLNGNIPESLGNLSNAIEICLNNNLLNGKIPDSIENLVNIEYLHLESNNLTGYIPNNIDKLTKLKHLYLQNNNISGVIPESLGNLANMTRLGLSYNNLTGNIPDSFNNLTKLVEVNLSNNYLTGAVPEYLSNLVSNEFFKSNFFTNMEFQNRLVIENVDDLFIEIGGVLDVQSILNSVNVYSNDWELKDNSLFNYEIVFDSEEKLFDENNAAYTCGNTFIKVKIIDEDFTTDNAINITVVDNKLPIINVVTSTNNWTNSSVEIIITVEDDDTVDKIVLPDGRVFKGDTVSTNLDHNGPYTIEAYDKYGNKSTKTINITNIDKDKPIVEIVKSNLKEDNTIDLNILANDFLSGIKDVKINDDIVDDYDVFNVKENGIYKITVTDIAGNIEEQDMLVDEIKDLSDREGPTIELVGNNTTWVNSNIKLNVNINDSSDIDKIILPNKSIYKQKDFIYTISENGEYIFEAYDVHGNKSIKSIVFNNIDKNNPTAVISKSNFNKIDNSVDVYIEAVDNESGIKSIKVNGNSLEIKPNSIFKATKNGVYIISVTDNAGNKIEKQILINEITNNESEPDLEKPILSYTLSSYDKTNKDVIINITATDNKGVKEIHMPDGKVIDNYSGLYTADKNGNYKFTAIDINNNKAELEVVIDNIDKNKILADVEQSELLDDNTIDLNIKTNKLIDEISEIKINNNLTLEVENPSINVDKNGTYQFYVEDVFSNKVIVSTTVEKIPFEGEDTEIPEIHYLLDNENWTNDFVNVSVFTSDNQGIECIILPDGTEIYDSVYNMKVYSNDTLTFTAKDLSGNTNSIVVDIKNLDNKAPEIIAIKGEDLGNDIEYDIQVIDDESGIDYLMVKDKLLVKDNQIKISVNKKESYNIIARDKSGNISELHLSEIIEPDVPVELPDDSIDESTGDTDGAIDGTVDEDKDKNEDKIDNVENNIGKVENSLDKDKDKNNDNDSKDNIYNEDESEIVDHNDDSNMVETTNSDKQYDKQHTLDNGISNKYIFINKYIVSFLIISITSICTYCLYILNKRNK